MHACYLINRSPTLTRRTPYEVLFKKTPTYALLGIFCSLCFASSLSHFKHKMVSRSSKCFFLGYPTHVKGSLLFDLDTKVAFISKDVHFYEQAFPFKERGMDETHHSTYAPVLPGVEFTSESMREPDIQESTTETPITGEVAETHHIFYPERLIADLIIRLIQSTQMCNLCNLIQQRDPPRPRKYL